MVSAVPQSQSPKWTTPTRKQYYLFGYPIAHSASPYFHNLIFKQHGLDCIYELSETKSVQNSEMLDIIKKENFGGASVTMPLKSDIIPFLDKVTPECQTIGSCNTLYLEKDPSGKVLLVGTNYDWVGIQNAILYALQPRSIPIASLAANDGHAFIIGSGATAKSSVYALDKMGFKTIYLINRDQKETDDLIHHFPQFNLVPLRKFEDWDKIKDKKLVCGVGAIPSLVPRTEEEKTVYKIAEAIFANKQGRDAVFLDMCYKPHHTILLGIASTNSWVTVGGVEAMLEQAYAQSKTWLLQSELSAPPEGFGETNYEPQIEEKVSNLIRNLGDITDQSQLPEIL